MQSLSQRSEKSQTEMTAAKIGSFLVYAISYNFCVFVIENCGSLAATLTLDRPSRPICKEDRNTSLTFLTYITDTQG